MKSRVYLETTIPSYLMAWPSRDILRAAEQEFTRTWWRTRDAFELQASELVVDECSAGDPEAAADRTEALAGIQLLVMTSEAEALGTELIKRAALPPKAAIDFCQPAASASLAKRITSAPPTLGVALASNNA